jgi:hypothetical protein
MKPKTIKITYWILTILFVLSALADAFGGLTHQPAGVKGVTHLGYPVYLMDISGVAKILGAIAILQTKYKTVKEWAYAGFTISFICAAWSHIYMRDSVGMVIMPVVMLAYMFLTYYFWKKHEQIKAI